MPTFTIILPILEQEIIYLSLAMLNEKHIANRLDIPVYKVRAALKKWRRRGSPREGISRDFVVIG
jgi:hypothetical protein